MPVPRGRVVGGSSAINAKCCFAASEDYDAWAALGNDQWSFTDCLPYLRKLETDMDFGADDFHNSEGHIPVRRFGQETWLPAQQAFYNAARDAGHPHDPDMNHPESGGVGPIPMNNPNGVRMSTSLTYLSAARHRLNLTVKANVTVHRLVFEGNRAVGAEVESGGETFHRRGRPDHPLFRGHRFAPDIDAVWRRAGGPPARTGHPGGAGRSRVGQNLRDHPNIRVPIEVKDDFPLNSQDPRTQVALRYTATSSSLRNDIQIMASSFSSPISGDPLEAEGIRFTCILELAYGSGNLTITSTDPDVQPQLNYNYFADDPRDLARMREAVRLCVSFLDHPDYADIVKDYWSRLPPTWSRTKRWTTGCCATSPPRNTSPAPARWGRTVTRWRWSTSNAG